MPKLVKLYIRSVLIGFGAAALFVAALVWSDLQGLGGVMLRSGNPVLALSLLWVLHGIVFAGVQFAWEIMAMAGSDPSDAGGRPLRAQPRPVPVTAAAPARKGPLG